MAKESLTVVIPTYEPLLSDTAELCTQISRNTLLPEKVVIIDNTASKQFVCPKLDLDLEVVWFGKNIGVNRSWNYGLSIAKTTLVSVLNADIFLPQRFFEKIVQPFSDQSVGIVVPLSTTKREAFSFSEECSEAIATDFLGRQGWAWTIRRAVLEKVSPIPEELQMFFGDDFIFACVRELGYKVVLVTNTLVLHKVGVSSSVGRNTEVDKIYKKEKQEWNRIKQNIGEYVRR